MISRLALSLSRFARSLKRRAVTDIGLTRADIDGMRRIW